MEGEKGERRKRRWEKGERRERGEGWVCMKHTLGNFNLFIATGYNVFPWSLGEGEEGGGEGSGEENGEGLGGGGRGARYVCMKPTLGNFNLFIATGYNVFPWSLGEGEEGGGEGSGEENGEGLGGGGGGRGARYVCMKPTLGNFTLFIATGCHRPIPQSLELP